MSDPLERLLDEEAHRARFPDGMPLGAAREALAQEQECPCCRQPVREYRRPLGPRIVRDLVAMCRAGEVGTPMHMPTITGKGSDKRVSGDTAKLRYWGLIERDPGWRAGHWAVTARGAAFVRGELAVPRYAVVRMGELLELDPDGGTVTIQAVLGSIPPPAG